MATDDKYDRQLRLWGAHGQRALMEAHVCVIGSSPCSTETMKNLVLPGIGKFTVIDDATVEEPDFGNNFFLEDSDLGKSRAESVARCLLEMNPDVQGEHVPNNALQILQEDPEFFRRFGLVIGCQLPQTMSIRLCEMCKEFGIPLMLITSVGFIGRIRLFVSEHTVCESKPDSEFGDLRLSDPFPELRRFTDSLKPIDEMDDAEHAHVPYVVILMRALDIFRAESGGKPLPATREEKDRFKSIIARMQRSPQEGNFAEALENAYKAWLPYSIPEPMEEVLKLRTANSKADFWVVARAVSQFVGDCGKLPLAGTLPDMTSSTEWFVRLQEIYQSRAEGDCAAIKARISLIQKEVDITRPISDDYVKRFCQNAQYCEAFQFRSLEEELRTCSPEEGGVDLACEVEDEDSQIQWYIALRAADVFREEKGYLPGQRCADQDEGALAVDKAVMVEAAAAVVGSYKVEGVTADPQMLEELVRYGGCELHTTSSVLGGLAAQEAVKLLTKQYTPLNNTLIYNGVHGKMQVLEL